MVGDGCVIGELSCGIDTWPCVFVFQILCGSPSLCVYSSSETGGVSERARMRFSTSSFG
jgi:hypothetical protein